MPNIVKTIETGKPAKLQTVDPPHLLQILCANGCVDRPYRDEFGEVFYDCPSNVPHYIRRLFYKELDRQKLRGEQYCNDRFLPDITENTVVMRWAFSPTELEHPAGCKAYDLLQLRLIDEQYRVADALIYRCVAGWPVGEKTPLGSCDLDTGWWVNLALAASDSRYHPKWQECTSTWRSVHCDRYTGQFQGFVEPDEIGEFDVVEVRRERWAFTTDELREPRKCKTTDELLATNGISTDRRGTPLHSDADSDALITSEMLDEAAEDEMLLHPNTIGDFVDFTDCWEDVVCDDRGFIKFLTRSGYNDH